MRVCRAHPSSVTDHTQAHRMYYRGDLEQVLPQSHLTTRPHARSRTRITEPTISLWASGGTVDPIKMLSLNWHKVVMYCRSQYGKPSGEIGSVPRALKYPLWRKTFHTQWRSAACAEKDLPIGMQYNLFHNCPFAVHMSLSISQENHEIYSGSPLH